MPSIISDFKRAWRLTKILRESDLSDENALEIEKLDSIYLKECCAIKKSLETTRRSFNRSTKNAKEDSKERLDQLENLLDRSILKISQLLDASQSAFSKKLEQLGHSSQTTLELVENIREYVSKQATETRRWQEGYDWRILSNYLVRVISALDEIETKLEVYRRAEKPADLIDDVDFLRETIEIHLEEEGLLPFSPDLGSVPDSTNSEVKASAPPTNASHTPGRVAEVIRRGFEIDLGAEKRVIRKAQVSIYSKKEIE